jgi:chromosome segregation ATPase
MTMEHQLSSVRENRPESSQERFDLKTLEVLAQKLRSILEVAPANQQPAFRDSLFAAMPAVTELLTRHDIQKDDDIAAIVEKLEAVQVDIRHEASVFRPAEEEIKVVGEPAATNDNEGKREKVMAAQNEINELYRLNQEMEGQQEKLKEELVDLDFFAIEKTEEDDDVLHTKMRIDQYHDEIEKLAPQETVGFLNRFLQREVPSSESDDRIQELTDKIIKAQDGLDAKYQQLQAKEARIQERIREIQALLQEPVAASGAGSEWRILVQQAQEAIKRLSGKLDEDYEQRQAEITEKESQRDSIASLEEIL